jgi:CheY-like chemotaxis protein
MSTILLADDSPHAQRMGERILREEGFQVSSVADGAAALQRLADIDPDLVIADAFLPGGGGLDLCRHIKKFHSHVRVILTAGQIEVLDV